MPLTPAEKMRRYRERLKENPQKFEEQRKKNLQRIKSKYEYKKITQMTNTEKTIQRQKWREQKRREKLKNIPAPAVSTNIAVSEKVNESYEIQKMQKTINRITRARDKYRKSLNYAENRVAYLTRLTERLKKKVYRMRLHYNKREEQLKARNEVLEISLRNTYKQCTSNKAKDTFKAISKDDAVKKIRAGVMISNALGLKGRIRKTRVIPKASKIKSSVVSFFLRDDVSRATAGKRECRTKNKKKKQIRYLNNTLHHLYDKFKREGGFASFASFCRYKPFFVLSPSINNRNTCLCVKHSNIEFKFAALKRAGVFDANNITDLLKSVVCNINKYDCMNTICVNCKTKSLPYNSEVYKSSEEITWLMWEVVDHKYNKNTDKGVQIVQTKKTCKTQKKDTIANLYKIFANDFKKFKVHSYNMWHQTNEYNNCIKNLGPGEAAIHCDFSENFECKMASEIQAMHFGASKNKVTLHTGMLFTQGQKRSFCTVSPSNVHQPHAIWAHLTPILDLAKSLEPNLNVVHIFSDGPSSQYRQKNNFYLTRHFATARNIKITWSFFESGHGKGVADAIGGVVKRALDRQIVYGKDVTNASDVHDLLLECVKSVQCYYITDQNISEIQKLLPTLKSLPGTMSIHQIITSQSNQIKYRILSCFCGGSEDCICFDPKIFTYPATTSTNNLNNLSLSNDINKIGSGSTKDIMLLPTSHTDIIPSDRQPLTQSNMINTDDLSLMELDLVLNENRQPLTQSDMITTDEISLMELNLVLNENLEVFADDILIEVPANSNTFHDNYDLKQQNMQSPIQIPERPKSPRVIITSNKLVNMPVVSHTSSKGVKNILASDKNIKKSLKLTTASPKSSFNDNVMSNAENDFMNNLNNVKKIRASSTSSIQSCQNTTSIPTPQMKSLRSVINRHVSCKQCKEPMMMHEVSRCITCNCHICQNCGGQKTYSDYIICANCFKSYLVLEKSRIMITINIDRFLCKHDLTMCLKQGIAWPWTTTHFIKKTRCYGCDNRVCDVPSHIISTMDNQELKMLLRSKFFLCRICNFVLYDHYPQDECDYCNTFFNN